jgi:hypothetical protein
MIQNLTTKLLQCKTAYIGSVVHINAFHCLANMKSNVHYRSLLANGYYENKIVDHFHECASD